MVSLREFRKARREHERKAEAKRQKSASFDHMAKTGPVSHFERHATARAIDSLFPKKGRVLGNEGLPFQDQIKEEEIERHQIFLDGLEDAGIIDDPENFGKRKKQRSQTRRMADQAAERIHRLTGKGYHEGETISFTGANSRMIDEIPPYWRSNANPYIAQQKRDPLRKFLTYYMEREQAKPGVSFRMWVLHDGPRCVAAYLPRRWTAQNGELTDWNESDFAERYDVKAIYRSNEAGSPVRKSQKRTWDADAERWQRDYERDENGNRIRNMDDRGCQTYHPHTHAIMRFGRWIEDGEVHKLEIEKYMSEGRTASQVTNAHGLAPQGNQGILHPHKLGFWCQGFEMRYIIKKASDFFGVPKLDAGVIRDPREACKYVVKTDELQDLKDIDFLRFLKWTYKRRLVAFYGPAKWLKKFHESEKIGIKAVYNPKTGKCHYRARKKPNANVTNRKCPELTEAEQREIDEQKLKEKSGGVIAAKLDPQAYHTPIKEPILMVRGEVNWTELEQQKQVQEILERTQERYEAAEGLFEVIYGKTVKDFMNGQPIYVEAPANERIGLKFTEKRRLLLGSAHNPPVISRPEPRFNSSAKPTRGKNERSDVPIGGPGGLFSNQNSQLPEEGPLDAANRSYETLIAGPSVGIHDPDNYF